MCSGVKCEVFEASEMLVLESSLLNEATSLFRVEVLTYSGNVLRAFKNIEFSNGRAILCLDEIPSGMYLLRFRDFNFTDIVKLKVYQSN